MHSLKSVFTALITPFDQHNRLDEEGLRFLIQRQLAHNIDGIAVMGTTGEAPTLSEEETERVIQIAREEIDQDTVFMVGTGSYDTKKTIKNTLVAQDLGADMALIVTPYYNRPTQEGLYRHFKAIAEATSLPIALYNIQGRTGQNLNTETLKRLIDIPSIIGIKEASGNISQISDVIELAHQKRSSFSVVSGDDALTLALMALGGQGIISVLSNLLPGEVKALTQSIERGNFDVAREMHYHLLPLVRALFIETNPIPIKVAMQHCGLPSGNCRLPLCDLSSENALKLKSILEHYKNAFESQYSRS